MADFCPINWIGRKYPCPFSGGMDQCNKLSGGCNPQYYDEIQKALSERGYPLQKIKDGWTGYSWQNKK